jgi:uncharacterized RDD family membrane protein YckC
VGVSRRFVALFIDGIILGIIFLTVSWITGMDFSGGVMTAQGDFASRVAHMSPGAALQIIPFVYFIVMEAMLGASVGKMALGIRVVKLDGSPMSWWQSIVRNLWRILDSLPSIIPYLLGDRLAHTVVVRRRSTRF